MTENDIYARLITAAVVVIVWGVIYLEVFKSSKGFPEPPEPKPAPDKPEGLPEAMVIPPRPLMIDGLPYKSWTKPCKNGVSMGFEVDEDDEITKKHRKLEKLKKAAMFGQEPPVLVDINELNNCKKWLWMIATVNACDYEYQKWAKMATNGEKCPHNFREDE